MNDKIYVAHTIALGAVRWLLVNRREELSAVFPHFFMRQADEMIDGMPSREEIGELKKSLKEKTGYVEEIGGQGILSALWRMAEELHTGLEIRLRDIPIRQETVEVLAQFDLNPYYALSTGALLIVTSDRDSLYETAARYDIPVAEIGDIRASIARTIRNGESIRYLDRPQPEELMKAAGPFQA